MTAPHQPATATRDAARTRLTEFVPRAGRTYAAKRNIDFGPGLNENVSGLSPFIRHRLLTEQETVAAVLAAHSASAAEKFIQEVCWRTYWKGWLEQRPQVWADYLTELEHQRAALREDAGLAAEVAAAERGDTGIACFDAWARELADTGTLHNHTRMWFASIWIFTLRLPWVLGADLFMRHLLDGDPASNTLSWRWVGGLHTRGKTYLARPDNIATYTNGRFKPAADELAAFALPLGDEPAPDRVALRGPAQIPVEARIIVLVTEEDLSPETWALGRADVVAVGVLNASAFGPGYAPHVRDFKARACADAAKRARAHWGVPVSNVATAEDLLALARSAGAQAIVTAQVPVGYLRPDIDALASVCAAQGVPVLEIARRWDALFWPHAKAGFFQLKDRIPAVLAKLGLAP